MNQAAKAAFKRDDKNGYQWNHYRIEAVGPILRTWVNGVPVAHLEDDRYLRGFIGLQLHANNENDRQGSFSIGFAISRRKREAWSSHNGRQGTIR